MPVSTKNRPQWKRTGQGTWRLEHAFFEATVERYNRSLFGGKAYMYRLYSKEGPGALSFSTLDTGACRTAEAARIHIEHRLKLRKGKPRRASYIRL